jgi:HAD superfamily hydrolase (TIGR01549 family)
VLAAAGHPVPPRAIGDALADAYNALHDEELSLFPDAHETLDRLKELGVKLALITNGATEPQRAKVIRFALEHRFDHIQIEGEHGFGKPEERAYNHVMVSLGVRPHETWVVGDNLEWEIAAPQRLGIYAIWHDGYGIGLPADCPIALTASSAACLKVPVHNSRITSQASASSAHSASCTPSCMRPRDSSTSPPSCRRVTSTGSPDSGR